MAGVTPAGLVIPTRFEIFNEVITELRSRVDPLWDDRSNNLINIYTNILVERESRLWSALQGVYDSAYPKSASDIALDNVADIVNVRRIQAQKSTGSVEFTGALGTTVPIATLLTVTDTNERFFTTSTLTMDATSFSDITVNVTSVLPSTTYTLTINNITCSVSSGLSPTANSILLLMKANIEANITGVVVTLPTSTTLRINVTENNSVYPLIVGARFGVTSISNVVGVEAEVTGVIKAPAGTLTTLPVPIGGVVSVNNLEDIREGRLRETDSELRVRRYQSVGIIGASTNNALVSNLRNLEGVTAAFIIENREFVTVDGIPPKSYMCVVEGGDEQEIADIIFLYGALGIQPYGAITRTVQDIDGNELSVSFSRPTTVHIKLAIEYTKYSEELFTASGEDGIKDAAIAYGNSLNIGNDVIPQRFFGNIFANVQGIQSISIQVAKSYNGGATWTSLQSTPLAISRTEATVFDELYVTVSEV